MKICTIFTGGTIGSVLDQTGYIGPKKGNPYRLLEFYKEQLLKEKQCAKLEKEGTKTGVQDFELEEIEFETIEPYRILSENLSAEHVLKLVQTIHEVLNDSKVDGIIVTHGTDTLQYGAALLGYVFGNARIPIVLVSSNYVLDDERANGLTNFIYAVEFIKGKYGKGVFVSYCNTGGVPTIHRATRLQPLIPYSDDVASVCDSWYGRFENSHFIRNAEYDVKEGHAAIVDNLDKLRLKDCSGEIAFIHPYVGMTYPKLTENTKVVLHCSYHSGTVCVNGPLRAFMKQANAQGIPVYLTGLLSGVHAYETVQEYETMGICVLPTASEVAQYCKLWLAVSNGLDVKQLMACSVAEDFI